jgi:5'-nucleotidase
MRLLIDMDGVLTNFNKRAWDKFEELHPHLLQAFPRPNPIVDFYAEDTYDDPLFKEKIREIQRIPGFFLELEEIQGAVNALHVLEKEHEVFICTAPLLENPTCCDDKMSWVRKHLGEEWKRRTIITKDKTVVDGDWLIDDKPLITGIQDPIWQRIVFDQPYNQDTVGRRLNWQNYKQIIDSIW